MERMRESAQIHTSELSVRADDRAVLRRRIVARIAVLSLASLSSLSSLGGVVAGCSPERILPAEVCGNGIDDDDDDLLDCADPECETTSVCREAVDSAPELPDWLEEADDAARPDLGVLTEECRNPDEFDIAREAESPGGGIAATGCDLLAENCGFGLRCILLSAGARAVETGCVRQGCGLEGASCAMLGLRDACASGHTCLDAPDACPEGPCCVRYCRVDDPDCPHCQPLSALYAGDLDILSRVGVCIDA